MADIVEGWETYISNRPDTSGVGEGCDSADVADVAGVAGETSASLLSALMFAYVLLQSVMVFSRYSLFQSITDAFGFVTVLLLSFGRVVQQCMVRASLSAHGSRTYIWLNSLVRHPCRSSSWL